MARISTLEQELDDGLPSAAPASTSALNTSLPDIAPGEDTETFPVLSSPDEAGAVSPGTAFYEGPGSDSGAAHAAALYSGLGEEVTFLSGLNPDGTLALYSYGAWNDGTNPADYSGGYTIACKWYADNSARTAGTPGGAVTYAFNAASGWSTAEMATFTAGLALWSAVADISFALTSDYAAAGIRFVRGSNDKASTSYDFAPLTQDAGRTDGTELLRMEQATISIDTSVPGFGPIDNASLYGGYPLTTVLHEEGHALGLGHGGPYNGTKVNSQQYSEYDTRLWSLMSYFNNVSSNQYNPVYSTSWAGHYPTTPMIADILAIQQIYGLPASTALSGGQVFGFNSNITGDLRRFFDFTLNTSPILTLWDSGSDNTLDLSGYSSASTVNLNPGTFSSVANLINNLAIAPNTAIDRLIGGMGADQITGNNNGNYINGGSGGDRIQGGSGNDTVIGGLGFNTLFGGGGIDTSVYSGNLSDFTIDFWGDGTVRVKSKALGIGYQDALAEFEFMAFADQTVAIPAVNFVTGDINNNMLLATAGNDYIHGYGGFNTVSYANAPAGVTVNLSTEDPQETGGSGRDTLLSIHALIGSPSNDTLTGNANANILDGGAGDDALYGGAGADRLYGGSGINSLTGGSELDVAGYALARSAYTITLNQDGSLLVTGGGAADTLREIEYLEFADQTIAVTSLGVQTILDGDAAGSGDQQMATVEQEVTFITGVGSDNKVAANTFQSWNSDTPATGGPTYKPVDSSASKFATTISPAPGSAGGTVTYYFDPVSAWDPTEKAMFRASFALWAAEANISFVENTGAANPGSDITIVRGSAGSGAFAGPGRTRQTGSGDGDVGSSKLWRSTNGSINIETGTAPAYANAFGPLDGSFSTKGGSNWQTLLHEIGHVLGLGHGGAYDGNINTATQQWSEYDSKAWTIMSYVDPNDTNAKFYGSYPVTGFSWGTSPAPGGGGTYDNTSTTPMAIDILAIQRLYGAATSGPLSGGQIFGFNTNIDASIRNFFDFTVNTKPIVTLWNSGTGNTLDLSGFNQNSTVNLNPGTFSSAGGLTNNICIAYNTAINTLKLGSGDDTATCNNNGDIIYGGAGSNTLTGGTGIDTAAMIEARASYTITRNGNGSVTVSKAGESDTLFSFERVMFTDLTVSLSLAVHDFNSDGFSDSLWRSNATRELAEWQMNGSTVTANLAVQTIGVGYTLISSGDFTGDGKADLLWKRDAQLAQWQMNGATVAANLALPSIASGYTLVGTGDFNGDGKADLLWQNVQTSDIALWQLDGATVTSNLAVQNVASGLRLVATGDFNGDGKSDLLWLDTATRELALWQMNGATVTSALAVPNIALGYTLVGVGDFNGDGKADLLWENMQTRELAQWQMNGATVTANLSVQNIAAGYHLAEVGDFNGDGKSDLLWQNGSQLAQWQMNGATVTANLSVPNIASGYAMLSSTGARNLRPATSDFTGDNYSDTLWLNTATREFAQWQMNGATLAANLAVQQIGVGYALVSRGDFNGDGRDDLLWQRGSLLAQWQMDGATVAANLALPSIASGYSLAGTGDFNGDGRDDLLWQNVQTNDIALWQLDGATVTSNLAVQNVAAGLRLVATGDFNGDGKSDLLWLNTATRELALWRMNGATVTSALAVPNIALGYTLVGVGDFNGDGRDDLLWENMQTRELAQWQMNGATVTANLSVQNIAAGYHLAEVGDFNADGMADLLWRNGSQLAQWQMNGATVTSNLAIPSIASGYAMLSSTGARNLRPATSDFTGDNYSDTLWLNTATREFAQWQMNGATVAANLAVQTIASGYTFISNGDFNGDGKADLLWRDGSLLAQWQMDGAAVPANLAVQNVAADLTLVGTGDFNGDGRDDLLWQNGSQLAMWLMDGATVLSAPAVQNIASGYALAGVGDFNGDGRSDLLWLNATTREIALWQMNGATVTSNLALPNIATGYTLAGVGDFNGDGRDDLLWKNGSELAQWQMNGATVTSNLALPNIATGYTLAEVGDFNADGLSDLLWKNGSELAQWQMNGATVTSNLAIQNIASGYSILATPTMG